MLLLPFSRTPTAPRAEDDDRGATAVEYAMLVSLIAAILVATITALGGSVTGLFGDIVDVFPVVGP